MVADAVGTRHADRKLSSLLRRLAPAQTSWSECAKRWQHSLDPSIDHSEWIAADDERLLERVRERGTNWANIRETLFPARSVTDIKNR